MKCRICRGNGEVFKDDRGSTKADRVTCPRCRGSGEQDPNDSRDMSKYKTTRSQGYIRKNEGMELLKHCVDEV